MIDTLTDAQLARTRARIHERINDEIVAPPRRRRSPAFVLAAVTAVTAFAVVMSPDGTAPEAATAATVLRGLEPQPLPRLGPGEYYAVRVVQREAANPAKALDLRYWTDADGDGRSVTLLDGKERRSGALAPPPGGGPLPALREFPTGSTALAAKMRELAMAQQVTPREPTTRDYILAASQMVTDERGTPPELLRAVFGFLSGLPGIQLVGEVADPLGRPGVAVAADGDPDIHEGVGVELIVNPATGRPLAMVHYRGEVSRPWLQTIREEGVVHDAKTLP